MFGVGKISADTTFALSLALVTVLAPAATDMYLASMPDIAENLKVSYASVQLTLTVFLLAQGLGQLFFGPLIDRYGRRGPLLAGIFIFAVSSVWAGFAGNITILLISRFVQGFSGALMLVVGFSSVRDRAEGTTAARIFAILMMVEGLAPVFAPIAGGFIDAHFGWRAVLLASAIMAGFALVNSYFHLPESLPQEKRIPLKVSVIASTYKRIFLDLNFLLPTLALSTVFFFLFAYISGGAYFYQTINGLSPDSFGLVFGLTGGAVMLGAMSSTRLVKKQKVTTVAINGIILMIVGCAVAFAASQSPVGLYGVVPGFMLTLYGMGMTEPALLALSMESQKIALGSTAALMGALHLMLSSLSTPVSGVLLPMGAEYWFVFLIISAVAALIITLAARRYIEKSAQAEQ